MERVLAGIRPDEVADLEGMLSLWERAGWIDQEEAAEWRRRILRARSPAPRAPAFPRTAAGPAPAADGTGR